MQIKWKEVKNITDPFVLIELQDSVGKTTGHIEDRKEASNHYTWNTTTYATGDISLRVNGGIYRLKIIGYKERFCWNGECPTGEKISSQKLFELITPYFELR